jgi:DNA-binding response OmpR family regulator
VREPQPAAAPSPDGAGWLEHRGLQLNTQTRLTQVDGRGVELTRSEFDLLATLMGSGRRVRSKADLVLALRGESYVTTYYVNDADKRAVEVHMANLRRKIGDSSATPRFIETVRGVGYRLASDRDS